MLIGRATKFCAGIEVFGDSADLRSLYKTISDLIDGGRLHEDHQEFILSLSYEIRKAYDGKRETEKFGIDKDLTYFGFKMLWPHFLFIAGQLRCLAAVQPTNSDQHANLYRLDHIIEDSLKSIDGNIGGEVWRVYQRAQRMPDDFLTTYIERANHSYVCEGSAGKPRFKRLPKLLASIDFMSERYRDYFRSMQSLANKFNCGPRDLSSSEHEWPEFQW